MNTATATRNDIVWLKNNQPRIFHLPDSMRSIVSKVGDQENQIAKVSLNDGKALVPSAPKEKDGNPTLNAVDAKYWDRVRSNKQVQSWIKRGWIEVIEHGEAGTEDPDTLAKFNAKTAETLIAGEDNLGLLADWQKTETRPELKQALSARIEVVKALSKKGGALPALK